MPTKAIECKDLHKSFILEGKRARKSFEKAKKDPSIEIEGGKAKVRAVRGVSFDVDRGEIFGFLGPNGAGKTTTVKILCTLLYPDSGEAWLNGFRIGKQDDEIRKRIGCVFGPLMNYHRLTGRDNLRFWGRLYGIQGLENRIKELSQMFGMGNRIDHLVEGYSTGMKCRLALMRGILHEPEILFLDEPTLGLDPSAALKVRELIKEMKQDKGTTVFLCTHYLAEAEFLCDRIGIISKGRIAAIGSPSDLESEMREQIFLEIMTDEEGLNKMKSAEIEFKASGDAVKIPLPDPLDVEGILSELLARKITIKDVRLSKASIEEVFVHFTSEKN